MKSVPKRWSKIDRVTMAVSLVLVSFAIAVFAASCGDSRPATDGANMFTPGPQSCATPQSGCPCAPGSVAACGKTVNGDQHFLYCYVGTRTCQPSGVYGDCADGTIVTKSVTAGLHTSGIGTAGPCGAATGPLLVCTSGKKQGEYCTTNLDCGSGVKRCLGGTDNGNGCKDDSDCADPGVCNSFAGTCAGGSNNGQGCDVAGDCPLGVCNPGGGGGLCGAFSGVCDNGSNDGEACNADAECPGGQCESGHGDCSGGKKNNKKCRHNKHCKGGGTCTGEDAGSPGVIDPCDPYCNQTTDTPTGLPIGSPLTLVDGGLTVGTVAAAGACFTAVDWKIHYGQYAGGAQPNGPLPTSCTVGPPAPAPATNDNCANDLKCVAGACVSRAPAESGTCAGVDFTVSTPCYNGTNFTFEVCNRGTLAATSGVLPIAHHNGSASPAASTCTRAVNGPAGQCNLDLGVNPLAPGQCRQITPKTDCGIDTSAGDHFFYVNYANTPAIAGPVLAECNTCNNFTATKNTAAGLAGVACTAVACGATGALQTTATGDSACGGAVNVHSNPCNAAPLTACQQDFHCDTASNTCKWNAGQGWYDATAGGIDLTIGAGCTYSGSDVIPLCNRGSVAVPANTILGVNITPAVEDGCSAVHATADCSVNVGATGLGPGKCTDVSGCPVSGGKNAVVNASGRDVAEAAGRCANNASAVKFSGGVGCSACTSCVTTLTGTIYDPRGANPLPNVLVYVPATTPAAMPGTLACDTCTSLATGNPTTLATTNFDGTFTLNNVPAGIPFPVVILSGRWRRQVTMTAIAACGSGVLPVGSNRLPRNKLEGDIPKMGIVSAAGDQLECLLRKIGVDDTEFTSSAGTGRIHLYSHNGMTVAGEIDGPTNLWGNAANLATYDFLVAPCDNNHSTYPVVLAGPNTTAPPNPTATAAQSANVKTYLNAGGRLFTSHWMSHDFVALNWPAPGGPVQEEYGTNVDADREAPAFPYTIDTTNPVGALFAQWAPLVGAGVAGPPPKITFNSWRHLSKTVNTASGAVRVSYGDSTAAPVSHPQNAATWGGPHVNMYTFDTPWGGPQCGRVVVSQSHVSSGGGAFPGGCADLPTVAMTPQEKGFEFLFFNATACLGLPPAPPPPPPPPVLPTGVTFTADFVGMCPTGTQPFWQLFEWQASVPAGTSIAFRAATAATVALLPAAPPPALPATVPVGTANDANAFVDPVGWSYDTSGAPLFTPRPVSYHLQNDPTPAGKSMTALRIYMTFNTAGGLSPTLNTWRQLYDCVPAE